MGARLTTGFEYTENYVTVNDILDSSAMNNINTDNNISIEQVKYSNEPQIIFIEGNVGAGKTTFLQLIEKSGFFENQFPTEKIAYVYEPVSEWMEYKDSTEKDILTYFYEDQEKYGFSFQWYVFMTRIKAIETAIDAGATMLFVERSIFTDRNVFMKTLFEKGKLQEIEHKMYMDWFDWISVKFLKYSFKFVYLFLSTEKCYERIKERSRDAENIIEYDYLDLLNKKHDEWLNNLSTGERLLLSAEYDNTDSQAIEVYMEKIRHFMV